MSSPDTLTCKELVELVTDYLEGRLSAQARERFEEHLGLCPGCHNHLDQARTTIALTGSLTEESIPPQARDTLLETFRTWKRGP
jgi:anti-sigma factor RsiW